MDEKTKQLWDSIPELHDVGTYEDFHNYLSTPDGASQIYNKVDKLKDVGSESDFLSFMGHAPGAKSVELDPFIEAAYRTGKIPAGVHPGELQIEPIEGRLNYLNPGHSYLNPGMIASDVVGPKVRVTLPDGSSFKVDPFTQASTTAGSLTKTVALAIAKSAVSGAEVVKNLAVELSNNITPGRELDFDYKGAFQNLTWTEPIKNFQDKILTNVPISDEYIAKRIALEEKHGKISGKDMLLELLNPMTVSNPGASGMLGDGLFWDTFFSSENIHTGIIPAVGSMAEFFIPGLVVGKAKYIGKATDMLNRAAKTSKVSKLELITEGLAKLGTPGDILLGANVMGKLEANMEAEEGAHAMAIDWYNDETGENIDNLEDAQNPEAAEEAKRRQIAAYDEIFKKNEIPLTILNALPLAQMLGKGKVLRGFGSKVSNFSKNRPILSAGVDTGLSALSEGIQEAYQTGVETYERDKFMNGEYNLDEGTWEGIWGAAKKGIGGISSDVDTTNSFIIGMLMGGGMTSIPNAMGIKGELTDLTKSRALLKGVSAGNFGSLHDVFTKDTKKTILEKIKGLNNYFINDDLIVAAEKLRKPELSDYAYTQAISDFVTEGLDNKISADRIKQRLSDLLDSNNNQENTYKDTNGSIISYEEFKQKKLDAVDAITSAYERVSIISSAMSIPESIQKNLINIELGISHFSKLIDNLNSDKNLLDPQKDVSKIKTIDNKIKQFENLVKKYSETSHKLTSRDNLNRIAREQIQDAVKKKFENDPSSTDQEIKDDIKEKVPTAKKKDIDEGIKKGKSEQFSAAYDEIASSERIEQELSQGNPDIFNQITQEIDEGPYTKNEKEVLHTVLHKRQEQLKDDIDDSTDPPTPPPPPTPPTPPPVDPTPKKTPPSSGGQLSFDFGDQTPEEKPLTPKDSKPKPVDNTDRDGNEDINDVMSTRASDGSITDLEGLTDDQLDEISYSIKTGLSVNDLDSVNTEFLGYLPNMSESQRSAFKEEFLANDLVTNLKKYEQYRRLVGQKLVSRGIIGEGSEFKFKDGVQKNNNKEKEDPREAPDPPEKLDPSKEQKLEATDDELISVLHIQGMNGRNPKLMYTDTAIDHDKGIAFLHQGKLKPGAELRFIVPIIPNQRREKQEGRPVTENDVIIQVVAKDEKGNDVVVGVVKFIEHHPSEKNTELRSRALKLYNESKEKEGVVDIDTHIRTKVTEIYKGHISTTTDGTLPKNDDGTIDFENDNLDIEKHTTSNILERDGVSSKDIEVGIVRGSVEKHTLVTKSTGKSSIDIDAAQSGFMYIIIPLIQKLTRHGGHVTWTPKRLFTKKVKDSTIYEDLKAFLNSSETNPNIVVQTLLDTVGHSLPDQDVVVEQFVVESTPAGVSIKYKGKTYVGESILTDLTYAKNKKEVPRSMSERAVHFSVHDIDGNSGDRTFSENDPMKSRANKNIKDYVLENTIAPLGKINEYTYEGDTVKSYVHSSKFSIDTNFYEAVPVKTSESSVEPTPEDSSDTKTPTIDRSKRKGRRNRPKSNPNYGKAKKSPKISNVVWEDNEKSKAWFKARLSEIGYELDDAALDKFHNLMGLESTDQLWGLATKAGVILRENRPVGTAKHEAFHIITQLFLTPKQRKQLYDEARTMFLEREGVEYSDEVLDEKLAQDFESYKLKGKAPTWLKKQHPVIARILDGLYNFLFKQFDVLQNYFTNDISVAKLYRQIENNSFGKTFGGKRRTSVQEVMRNNLEVFDKELAKITSIATSSIPQRITYLNRDLLNYILEEYFDNKSLFDLLTNSEDKPKKDRNSFHNLVFFLKEMKIELEADIETFKENEPDNERGLNELNKLHELFNPDILLEKLTIDESDPNNIRKQQFDFMRRLLRDLEYSQGVILGLDVVYKRGYVETEIDNDPNNPEFVEATEEIDNYESWQLNYVRENSFSRITPKLKKVISNIIMMDGFTNDGTPLTDEVGALRYYDSGSMFNLLVDHLAGTRSINSMMATLKKAAIKDYRLAQFHKEIKRNPELKKALWIGIGSKYKAQHLMVKMWHRVINGQRLAVPSIFYSNRKTAELRIKEKFVNNFTVKNLNSVTGLPKDTIGALTVKEYGDLISKEAIKSNHDTMIDNAEEALVHMGFEVTENTVKYLQALDPDSIKEMYDGLRYLYARIKDKQNPVGFTGDKNTSENKSIRNIARILKDADPGIDTKMFTNGKNKLVSNHVQAGFIFRHLNHIADNIEQYKNAIFYGQAPILRHILNNKDTVNFAPVFFDARKEIGAVEGQEYTDMKDRDLFKNHFDVWIARFLEKETNEYTYYHAGTLADAPSMYYINLPALTNTRQAKALLEDVFNQEMSRIRKVHHDIEKYTTTGNKNLDDNGRNFHFFPSLNKSWSLEARLNLTWKDVSTEVFEYLNSEFDAYKTILKDEGLVKSIKLDPKKDELTLRPEFNGMFNPSSIDLIKDKKLKATLEKAKGNNQDVFESLLELHWYSQFVMNTQIFTLTSGDPAAYKKDKGDGVTTTSGDYQKRHKQIHSPGIYGDWGQRDKYGVVYINDIYKESTREFKDQVKENLENAGFEEKTLESMLDAVVGGAHTITDAQGYVTLDRWKEVMMAFDKWTPELEDAFDRIKSGIETAADLRLALQPLKPHYFDLHEAEGYLLPVQHKYSAIPLIPSMIEDTKLQGVLDAMMKNDVDEVLFSSAVKAGLTDVITMEDFITGELDPTVHVRNNASFKWQQDVPEHYHPESNNRLAVQIRKLILSNVNAKDIYSNSPALKTAMKELGLDYKELSGEAIKMLFDELISVNINTDLTSMLGELGKKDDIKDRLYKLRNILLKEIDSRGLGEQYREAIEIVGDQFKLPVYSPVHSYKLESIFNSFFKKVIKQRHNGGSYVNMSSFGYSDDLKIRLNKDGSIKYVEVALPKFLQLEGINENTREVEAIKEGIVYRIPTEDKYSMFPIKVVKWLPSHSGGVIAMPREVTTLAGLDFDVDKVYAMFYNFSITKDKQVFIPRSVQDRKGRENLLLDIMSDTLKHKNTFKEWIQPGGFKELEDIRDKLIKEGLITPSTNLPIAIPQNQVKFSTRNIIGAKLIGIFANDTAFHAVSQGLEITLGNEILSPVTVDGNKNRYVSRNFATLLAAAVDNAKEPILGDLGITEFTAPLLTTLLHVGEPLESAIREINKDYITDIEKQVNNGTPISTFLQNKSPFKNLYTKSRELSSLIQAVRVGGGDIGPTFHEVDKKLSDIREIHKSTLLNRVGRILPNVEVDNDGNYSTWQDESPGEGPPAVIKAFVDVLIAEANFANDLVPYFKKPFQKVKDIAKDAYLGHKQMTADIRRVIDLEHLTMMHVPNISSIASKNPSEFVNMFPYWYAQYKDNYLKDRESTKYANMLNSFVFEKGDIVFDGAISTTGEFLDIVRGEWEDALQSSDLGMKFLAENLVVYSMYTNGYHFKRGSYSNLIPIEYFNKDVFRNTNSIEDSSLVALYAALHHPDKLLPKFSRKQKSVKDKKRLIKKAATQKEDATYVPMYAVKKADYWTIFINSEFNGSNYNHLYGNSYTEITAPTYRKYMKDAIGRSVITDVEQRSVQEAEQQVSADELVYPEGYPPIIRPKEKC